MKDKNNYNVSEYYNEDEDEHIPTVGDADFDYNSWEEEDPEAFYEWMAEL